MTYEKPQVVAQNNANGSFAAGCLEKDHWSGTDLCRRCELAAA